MSGPDDPYGRRSLFTRPGDAPDHDDAGVGVTAGDRGRSGRRALFSDPPPRARRAGPVVECARCGGRRALDPLRLAVRLVPSLWWPPAGRHSRYLRCPTCDRWAWCRVEWGRP